MINLSVQKDVNRSQWAIGITNTDVTPYQVMIKVIPFKDLEQASKPDNIMKNRLNRLVRDWNEVNKPKLMLAMNYSRKWTVITADFLGDDEVTDA